MNTRSKRCYWDGTWLAESHRLGTPRMVFDESGAAASVKRHDYLPFGEELLSQGLRNNSGSGYASSDGIRQQFTAKERDVETGLDYFLARYYSSSQGRFVSVDPLKASGHASHPQTWNRYSYVLNNPLRLTDSTGMVVDTMSEDVLAKRKTEHNEKQTESPHNAPHDTPPDTPQDSLEGTTLHYWPSRVWRDAEGNQIDKSPYGHVALQLSDGTYISYWPGEHLGPLDVGKEVRPSLPRTYLDDYNGERKTDSQVFTVYGLDEAKIKKWWNNGEGHGKFSSGNSCADIVTQALREGGLAPRTTNLIWSTPEDVWKGTKAAVEARQNPKRVYPIW